MVFFDTRRQGGYYATFVLPAAAGPATSSTLRGHGSTGRGVVLGPEVNQMSIGTKDDRMHGRFDAFELSAEGAERAGEIDARDLPRVSDQLAETADAVPIAWRISGGHDGLGQPSLTVRIDGTVLLVCQRCLQPFGARVTQQTDLLLARDEAELTRLDAEETEVVLANTALDPRSLVEDELLLSLPLSPRHGEDECPAAGRPIKDEPRSPFAGLAGLKARNPD
jgi:uncharacterized protein